MKSQAAPHTPTIQAQKAPYPPRLGGPGAQTGRVCHGAATDYTHPLKTLAGDYTKALKTLAQN